MCWPAAPSSSHLLCPSGTAEAAALERELLDEYRFGRQQLVELCGHASAVAVTKAFPLPSLSRKQRTVLVVCGPEQNGAVGLACARHLRVFDYQPSIFCPARSADVLHRDLTTQCEKMDIPFLSFLPAEVRLVDDAYGLVVDAVLGPGVRPAEAGEPCARALATLKRLSIPLVSLDVPSGTPPQRPPPLPVPPFQLFQPQFPHLPSSCFLLVLRTGTRRVAAPTRLPQPPLALLQDRRELARQRPRLPGPSRWGQTAPPPRGCAGMSLAGAPQGHPTPSRV
ncbi:yjeF N-terminal domain-containing protein 3 isoform X2 [Meriones unguiculatus]|uniref:yjeF N-terminal domain-containing protein 3 isoform X2 n=1 Tax=Meriones unguiculatus TaxID=10047 RepID=UPI000B4F173C|nr:yjeF N-terminal domain-containing protein 3 isoform X2 [Meriones unguiculatus]